MIPVASSCTATCDIHVPFQQTNERYCPTCSQRTVCGDKPPPTPLVRHPYSSSSWPPGISDAVRQLVVCGGNEMLELRPTCEHCNKPLPPDSLDARICTYECTFCAACVEHVIGNVCPNCGGGFVPSPIRPSGNWKGLGTNQNDPAGEEVERATASRRAWRARARPDITVPMGMPITSAICR